MKRQQVELLEQLAQKLQGDLHYDEIMRKLYATDASAYREMPLGVALPKGKADLLTLVRFADEHQIPLIPRTAGTSLAGQVVGAGLVVDVSKNFDQILSVDPEKKQVTVQPGVIRDVLNMHLRPQGLFFGPETSTASRAMIGGMVGNNSCGSNSIVYGSARDQLVQVKALLADGSDVTFEALSLKDFEQKCEGDSLEATIYRGVREMLSVPEHQEEIRKEFPKPSIPRRNTGYAIDLLLETAPFTDTEKKFNFCDLIAGSEGTLALIYEITLQCAPLPPAEQALVAIHFDSVDESLRGNLIALKHDLWASELMDQFILDCTANSKMYSPYRFFVKGDPGAILAVDISRNTQAEVEQVYEDLLKDFEEAGLGYHFPLIQGEDCKKVWALRKAGLGLLSNMPGDTKPAPVIEDTAVDVADLPAYIRDFNEVLKKYELSCVHYAHAGSGELHLRPILNLKTKEGNEMFRTIAQEIAVLVKKYKGSLSGEHGDGRLRGEFIPYMIGEQNYELVKQVKLLWDPKGIFNPNKIVETPRMNSSLRFEPGHETPEIETILDFSDVHGVVRAAENCNGTAICIKSYKSGGTMCPSYMATREEKNSTRARANILREVLNNNPKANRFDSEEIKEVLDLCLSCKGCKSECPSNVDIGKIKAEFLQQYYDANGAPFRSKLIANVDSANQLASLVPGLYNFVVSNSLTSSIFKAGSGFAKERSIPKLHSTTLRNWFEKRPKPVTPAPNGKVYFFCDEFTNYNDTPIGQTAIKLLERLGYEVLMPKHVASGRSYLSKGFLRKAKNLAEQNVNTFSKLIDEKTPLVGLEPSAILTFRDEYPDLLRGTQQEVARQLGQNALMIDEFLDREMEAGKINKDLFTKEVKKIKLHGHCQQKAVSSLVPSKRILSFPAGYTVEAIPSGCCGMAGSFGYEKEHYELSMKIGELVLFPTVRQQPEEVLIAATGTSCRHQIKDGTNRIAKHPVEILYEALV
ncbi:FAD-binding and (Fe-S)-binding domain-containing protein [Persicobacter sp. CCB-QB2]|uniref:FAD-binding and (Fe-S)-binding domain-containing protein n=1 Tax=Persicobacter sp. CCB-QB2 TaxID=1561025 RepID=UPI0006A9A565|nr:FAD-binding and (Fe-S)-binding domain-containing protein [Persicobacter sp. CCB-QB2]